MDPARCVSLAVASLAVGCSLGRAPTRSEERPRACEGASAATCEPAAATDLIACDSTGGALLVPLGDRCVPFLVSPLGWEHAHAGMAGARTGAPPAACDDRLRIEKRSVDSKYSVLEIHAGEERLVSRDPAPVSHQALLSPDCRAAWFWEPGGGWLFSAAEGAWERRWFGELGAVVSAGFSPDGGTLFTAGTDAGHLPPREALLVLCAIDARRGAVGECQRIPAPAGTLSEVATSTAGAFVQLSWSVDAGGRLEEHARLFGFTASGLSLQATGDAAHATHVRLSASGGARPLLFVVTEDWGTWIYDARDLRTLARWPEEGRSGNAFTAGASPSPDGEYFAIPEPYRRCVTFIRSRDLHRLGRLCGKELTGAGRILWPMDAIIVETFPLPYE